MTPIPIPGFIPRFRVNRQYINNLTAIRRYAAEVSGVDGGVDRLEAFFKRYAEPEYDLWHGGGAKSHLLTGPGGPAGRP